MPALHPEAIPADHPFRRKGRSTDGLFRFFFASNAGLTILILILIIVFLVREGAGFFPGYQRELEIYRKAGLEFVDISRRDLTAHEQLASLLDRAYYADINGRCRVEMLRADESAALVTRFTEVTAPARDALARVREEEQQDAGRPASPSGLRRPGDGRAAVVAAITERYEQQRANAMASLPATPHLTDEERAAILAELARRAPEAVDEPAGVTALAEALRVKQAALAEPMKEFREAIDAFAAGSGSLGGLVVELTESVTAIKDEASAADIRKRDRASLLAAAEREPDAERKNRLLEATTGAFGEELDFGARIAPVVARLDDCLAANGELKEATAKAAAAMPAALVDPDAARYLRAFRAAWPAFVAELDDTPGQLRGWDWREPVGLGRAIRGFLTGRDWVTGGEWQDFYGILPLLVGSCVIALIALVLAIPAGVGAAIYVNQLARRGEQTVIKPVIEFIQAIPSVVLGFIGIAVVGTFLRDVSLADTLQWVPGFPIQERLNMFTAGCLLGLMAVPTVFSLSEDALNNVPAGFAEASDALGASHLQTVFRVVVPAAVSGILAACLLGLGRVIGETMVVLLVAGNRIKIPDFTEGLGTVFQPSHTLTGIIAQELGEVPFGSLHYRALFVVGLLLFVIVLSINWAAQRLLKRFRIGHH